MSKPGIMFDLNKIGYKVSLQLNGASSPDLEIPRVTGVGLNHIFFSHEFPSEEFNNLASITILGPDSEKTGRYHRYTPQKWSAPLADVDPENSVRIYFDAGDEAKYRKALLLAIRE